MSNNVKVMTASGLLCWSRLTRTYTNMHLTSCYVVLDTVYTFYQLHKFASDYTSSSLQSLPTCLVSVIDYLCHFYSKKC